VYNIHTLRMCKIYSAHTREQIFGGTARLVFIFREVS